MRSGPRIQSTENQKLTYDSSISPTAVRPCSYVIPEIMFSQNALDLAFACAFKKHLSEALHIHGESLIGPFSKRCSASCLFVGFSMEIDQFQRNQL
jgi:hypothetical protein